MSAELRVLAVDDERSALDDLARLLDEHPDVAAVSIADSAGAALQTLSRSRVDAIFLDVRMPDIDGLDLARVIRSFHDAPAIVFVSAYDSEAVAAFELRAVDYLVKPVTRARISEAIARVRPERSSSAGRNEVDRTADAQTDSQSELLAVSRPTGGGLYLLSRSSILYFEAYGDYQRVFSTDGRFLLRAALADLERKWSDFGFVRVHRRYLVNLRHATAVRQDGTGAWVVVMSTGKEVSIARRHLSELRRRLRP